MIRTALFNPHVEIPIFQLFNSHSNFACRKTSRLGQKINNWSQNNSYHAWRRVLENFYLDFLLTKYSKPLLEEPDLSLLKYHIKPCLYLTVWRHHENIFECFRQQDFDHFLAVSRRYPQAEIDKWYYFYSPIGGIH